MQQKKIVCKRGGYAEGIIRSLQDLPHLRKSVSFHQDYAVKTGLLPAS